MALIFGFSSVPDLRVAADPDLDFIVRKLGHAVAFGVLAVLYRVALGDVPRGAAIALVLAVAYAASDELHQAFTVGRHPAVTDVAIDSLGAVVALGVVGRFGLPPRSLIRPRAEAPAGEPSPPAGPSGRGGPPR
jgi:VanZ family protein